MPRLRRSQPAGPGYARVGGVDAAETKRYRDPAREPVTDRELIARFDALVVPPAWTEVWLCPHPNGHIQATGLDAAGRRQYLYHPAWRTRMDAIKFDRALELAQVLPAARGRARRHLRLEQFPRERALAAGFRMLDVASLRVGTEKYALEHGSFGLASLLWHHATVSGDTVSLDFPAKGQHAWRSDIDDDDLAAFVRERRRRAAARQRKRQRQPSTGDAAVDLAEELADDALRLLAFRDGRRWRALSAEDINEEVRALTGGQFTAKDFRTLHGTIAAARYLAETGHAPSEAKRNRVVAAAMRAAAQILNNTPAVARSSYVDPRVVDHYHQGRTIDPAKNPEVELLRLIGGDDEARDTSRSQPSR